MTLSADDRGAIADLAARYCHRFDLCDPAGWAECFTADGVFETPLGDTICGHQALHAFADSFRVPTGLPAPMRQFPAAMTIDGDDTQATLQCYFTAYILLNPPLMIAMGRFEDELRKTNGHWKIARRREILDWTRFPLDSGPAMVLAALREAVE
ncbi:MAG: nuclear transport factor 2 family protein [Dehalococcoidia bacterium]